MLCDVTTDGEINKSARMKDKKMVKLNFQEINGVPVELEHKLFTGLKLDPDRKKINEDETYYGYYAFSLTQDLGFDPEDMFEINVFGDKVFKKTRNTKRAIGYSVRIIRKEDIFYFYHRRLSRNAVNRTLRSKVSDCEYFNIVFTIYKLFFPYLIKFSEKWKVKSAEFYLPKEDVVSMGFEGFEEYEEAEKNENGDMLIYKGTFR